MKSIISYTLFVLTAAMLLTYILYSSFIHQQAVEKELIITEACKTFLDTVTDKGALSERDYNVLVNQLGRTGATFKITVLVDRLYAIPAPSGGDFYRDFRPAYAFSSDKGDFPSTAADGSIIVPTQYFRKFDSMTLIIQQTSMMTYQTNLSRQLSMFPEFRTWSFNRGVRSNGNSIVNNEPPPIPYATP